MNVEGLTARTMGSLLLFFCKLRDFQSGTWSAGQEKIRGTSYFTWYIFRNIFIRTCTLQVRLPNTVNGMYIYTLFLFFIFLIL